MLNTKKVELLEIPFEALSQTTALFFIIVSIILGLNTLTLTSGLTHILTSILAMALFFQAGLWTTTATSGWINRKKSSPGFDRALISSLSVINFIFQILIWSIVSLLILDNLGVNITTLVAGLGIGGIAVALAVQNILGDLLASLSITFDRPFILGDFLIVDNFLGAVEHIGVKTTRLRSLSGEQIIISNADLLKTRVRNYGRMAERRIVFKINVVYDTSIELIEKIPFLIQSIIESEKTARFDRSHFFQYSQFSLEFESVYYVLSSDYNQYMDIQQSINLKIFQEFKNLGIKFAYLTQDLHVLSHSKDSLEEKVIGKDIK